MIDEVERHANRKLFQIQVNRGVSLSSDVKLSRVGSCGTMVGGHSRISCGVLKALATRNTSGSSIESENAMRKASMAMLVSRIFKRRRGSPTSSSSAAACGI